MNELTRKQFQAAVAAAISGVEHLYREVDLLIAGLREHLAEDPEPALKRGTLGKAGKEDSKRVVVRYEYGALFEPAADDDDDNGDDEEVDDDGPEEADEPSSHNGRKGRHEIIAGQPLLAVRIARFDPRKRVGFEPQCQFAVMSGWTLGDAAQPEDRFTLQSYMLKRVARSLADRTGAPNGSRPGSWPRQRPKSTRITRSSGVTAERAHVAGRLQTPTERFAAVRVSLTDGYRMRTSVASVSQCRG